MAWSGAGWWPKKEPGWEKSILDVQSPRFLPLEINNNNNNNEPLPEGNRRERGPPLAVGLSHTPSRARGQRALNLAMRVPTLQPGKISALGRKPCESCLSWYSKKHELKVDSRKAECVYRIYTQSTLYANPEKSPFIRIWGKCLSTSFEVDMLMVKQSRWLCRSIVFPLKLKEAIDMSHYKGL